MPPHITADGSVPLAKSFEEERYKGGNHSGWERESFLPGVGWDGNIFFYFGMRSIVCFFSSVRVGWDRNENPLPCHVLLRSTQTGDNHSHSEQSFQFRPWEKAKVPA